MLVRFQDPRYGHGTVCPTYYVCNNIILCHLGNIGQNPSTPTFKYITRENIVVANLETAFFSGSFLFYGKFGQYR